MKTTLNQPGSLLTHLRKIQVSQLKEPEIHFSLYTQIYELKASESSKLPMHAPDAYVAIRKLECM